MKHLLKKFEIKRLIVAAMVTLMCVGMWGCGVDDGWGEREFRAYDVAKVVGFVDDSLVIVADSREWMQETPDYAIGGHGHQRLRVFNYRIQEDGPRWVDTLDNFVDECDYVLGQLSDSVVWGGQPSLYTKVWKGPLMTFWKIGEKPIVKNISVETERCSQTFFVKNMRSWIEESIIVLSEKSLRYGGDTCQYAVLDTVAGTLTFKRLDENLKWIQKCDDVRAWGDDVYCVILDNEGENSLILKNINDTIPTPRKFAIGGFWGNMIKLSGNICSIHDDEITCSDVIWYGNELKFYENGEVVVDLE
ncbi:hypothetical protein [Fibrobacter sp.]|uniref:hypothetical protein n=2 Tax=Fibrobacter TaxID=832 RepID=UPI0025BF2DF9|nr:hypothetical protein [Fibrobacter sp.]MCI6438005.1 hypothetical protein [Fibrobacter sp.]